jgi:tetratricopeptide (TPR) repeat protein
MERTPTAPPAGAPSGPQGYRDIPLEDRKKAKAFFDRGTTVAATGNFDYAIEMYLQGLSMDPEAVDAHQILRDISLKRKASGGKAIGMLQMMKLKAARSKDEKESMLNAERLLAHDPGNTDHMVSLMQYAQKGGYYDTVMWIGPILLKANIDGKNETSKYLALRDTYIALHQWRKATEATQYALATRPNDMDLQREVKDLSARQTMSEGNYESAGDFRGSIRDREGQERLQRLDSDIRTEDQMSTILREAEAEFAADPEEPGKLIKLVDVYSKTDNPEYENKAIDLLNQFYERTKQFRFRLRIGEIRMRQLGRLERSLRERVLKNPSDKAMIKEYKDFLKEKNEQEYAEYTLASENYPTQLDFKYQMARRLFDLERYGEAIPVFQQARQDPKFRVDASVMLGRAFLEAAFVDEAVDTLKVALDDYQIKGDEKSIEMTYWYARSLEEKGEKAAAIKAYSQVAQWNFNYKDVQQRIKRLRST